MPTGANYDTPCSLSLHIISIRRFAPKDPLRSTQRREKAPDLASKLPLVARESPIHPLFCRIFCCTPLLLARPGFLPFFYLGCFTTPHFDLPIRKIPVNTLYLIQSTMSDFDDFDNDEGFASFDLDAAISSYSSPTTIKRSPPAVSLLKDASNNTINSNNRYAESQNGSLGIDTSPNPDSNQVTSKTSKKKRKLDSTTKSTKVAKLKVDANGGSKQFSLSKSPDKKQKPNAVKCDDGSIKPTKMSGESKQEPSKPPSKNQNLKAVESDDVDIKILKVIKSNVDAKGDLKQVPSKPPTTKKQKQKEVRCGDDSTIKSTKVNELNLEGKGDSKQVLTKAPANNKKPKDVNVAKLDVKGDSKQIPSKPQSKKQKQKAIGSIKVAEFKVEAKGNSQNTPSKPPAKSQKPKAVDVVVKTMKVAELKLEAIVRGIELKEVSSITKDALLNRLVVGSFCITKSSEWGEILRLREKVAMEHESALQMRRQEEEEAEKRWHEREVARQEKEQAEKEKRRCAEMQSQEGKHMHDFPAVHGCKLAKTKDLIFLCNPRHATCSECNTGERSWFYQGASSCTPIYTCEKCDFDVCSACFKRMSMTPKEKKAEEARVKRMRKIEEKEQREQAEEERIKQEEEEEIHNRKWNAKINFKPSIINPPNSNIDPNGNKMKGYTVWCSDGYGNDGWHHYEGPPDKEFDTTYATIEDANARARYLFYWKNPWGLPPEDIDAEEEISESIRHGLNTFKSHPPDSSIWTVAVVPDVAYAHMEGATSSRHNFDDGNCDTSGKFNARKFFF